MKHLTTFKLFEGVAFKAAKNKHGKEKSDENKKELMRGKIEGIIKSNKCQAKLIGNDFEIHCDGEHIAQVMFRDELIAVKRMGNKFPKEFKYDELGKIKTEIISIIKDCCGNVEYSYPNKK